MRLKRSPGRVFCCLGLLSALQIAVSVGAEEQPGILERTSQRADDVAVQGPPAQIGAENELSVVIVSNPAKPILTDYIFSHPTIDASPGHVCNAGNNAFSISTTKSLNTRWVGGAAIDFGRSTDVVVLNKAPVEAEIEFLLNTPYGDMDGIVTIPASSQRTIHLAGMMGHGSAGAIRVRSSQPVIVNGHITDTTRGGKCGQFIKGQSIWRPGKPDGCWGKGWLVGLRQMEGRYRTDFLLTNPDRSSGPVPVEITLFATDGRELVNYLLEVESGATLFNPAPLKVMAGRSDLAWGYARIEGYVEATASVVDLRTGDATTVPMIRDSLNSTVEASEWRQWLEIAASCNGNMDSSWRTDLIALNPGEDQANVDLIFHGSSGESSSSVSISGSKQAVFQDIVGVLASSGKGLMEIRSDRPLAVSGRVYNTSDAGTAGHALLGCNVDKGLIAGETVWLAGLRQVAGTYRTNINVSNLGESPAAVRITLFDASGDQLADFTREVSPKRVIQDIEPFAKRGREPNLEWGFARVTLEKGRGIFVSASVINCHTNDAIMVPMER